MRIGDFEKFVENVKEKTNLTRWLQQIKSNPKDELVYLTLADFLGDQGGLDAMVGDYLRNEVQLQAIYSGTKDSDVNDPGDLDRKNSRLGYNISEKFQELGIGTSRAYPKSELVRVPKKLTQHHRVEIDDKTPVRIRMNYSEPLSKMSSTIGQHNDRPNVSPGNEFSPHIKRHQLNNVAWHDLADRNVQLFGIFLIAQKIGANLLVLNSNYKPNCDDYGNIDISYLLNSWVASDYNEEDELVRNVRNYQRVLPYLVQSWNCCDKFTEDSVSGLYWQLQHLDVEDLNDGYFENWAAKEIVVRWINAIVGWRKSGCEEYRKQVGSIIKDFRNSNKVWIRHRDRV